MAKWQKYNSQFYGITQSGKTTRALEWLCSFNGLRIYIDTKNECKTKPKFRKIFNYIAPLSDTDVICNHFKEFVKNNIKIALVPNLFKLDKEMKYFCKKIWEIKRNNKLPIIILFDEIQEYTCWKTLRSLFVQGLGKNMRCGLTSQGWSQVKKNIRNRN